MKILAVDTSSKNCSVSILEVNENIKCNSAEINTQKIINKNHSFNILISENNNDEKTHSQKLMPMIDDMFRKAELSLDNMDLLACCLGPGSFTGIRIGIATIKAFADVKNIPTVGVTSLESLAYNVEKNGFICPIIDCKNENVYSSLFVNNNYTYSQIGDNIADSIGATLDKIIEYIFNSLLNSSVANEITFVGDGSTLYKDLIISKFSDFNTKFSEYCKTHTSEYNKDNIITNLKLNFSENNIQSSISLGRCAYNKYLNKEFGDSNFISPLYLRKSQAERAKDNLISISPMTMDDFEVIKNILQTDFDDLWNSEILKEELSSNNSKYIVAKNKDNNTIVGFAGIKIIMDEAELMNIVTRKSTRHQGIAKAMMDALISMCNTNNVKILNLEVNTKNTIAINLYKKYNFKEVGLRKKYYNNTYDALLMSLSF